MIMEILLNELSLEGQYSSLESFVSTALISTLKVFKEISGFGHLMLKKEDIFNAMSKDKFIIDIRKPPDFSKF